MIVETSRFGELDVNEKEIITFPEGMLGFSKIHKYFLVEHTDDSLFLWLQALKKPNVAFPLLEPQLFELKYRVELCEEDRNILKLEDLKFAKVFSIVTIPSDPTKMTSNLRAPIVLNLKKRLARQVILVDATYPIRKSIFTELQQHCATSRRTIFPESAEHSYQTISITDELEVRAENEL